MDYNRWKKINFPLITVCFYFTPFPNVRVFDNKFLSTGYYGPQIYFQNNNLVLNFMLLCSIYIETHLKTEIFWISNTYNEFFRKKPSKINCMSTSSKPRKHVYTYKWFWNNFWISRILSNIYYFSSSQAIWFYTDKIIIFFFSLFF